MTLYSVLNRHVIFPMYKLNGYIAANENTFARIHHNTVLYHFRPQQDRTQTCTNKLKWIMTTSWTRIKLYTKKSLWMAQQHFSASVTADVGVNLRKHTKIFIQQVVAIPCKAPSIHSHTWTKFPRGKVNLKILNTLWSLLPNCTLSECLLPTFIDVF